jgi:hypothetical protein
MVKFTPFLPKGSFFYMSENESVRKWKRTQVKLWKGTQVRGNANENELSELY